LKSSHILGIGLLLAVVAMCPLLFRGEPTTVPPSEQPAGRSSPEIDEDSQPSSTRTRTSLDSPLRDTSPTEESAPTIPDARAVRLHVLDDASGDELRHIALYRVSSLGSSGIVLLSKKQLSDCVGSDLDSPITIEPDESRATKYLALNGDHAWGQIRIDPSTRGDSVLRLGPGGSLLVTMEGAEQFPNLFLMLARMDSTPPESLAEWSESELEPGPLASIQLDGLPTGTYRVHAELGHYGPREMLASRIFTIRAGMLTGIALSKGERVAQPVELRIAIIFDPQWALDEFVLDVAASDNLDHAGSQLVRIPSPEMVRASTDTFECKVTVDSGLYRFTILDAAFETQAMIGPESVQPLTLLVAAPGLVVVNVVDDEGSVVADARLELLGKRPEPPFHSNHPRYISEKAPGRFEFRAPIGPLGLVADSPTKLDLSGQMQLVDVVSGTNPVTLRMTRDNLVILRLFEGKKELRWAKEWVELPRFERYFEHARGEEVFPVREYDARSGFLTLRFAEAGSLRLDMKIPGFSRVGDPGLFYFGGGSFPNRLAVIDIPVSRE